MDKTYRIRVVYKDPKRDEEVLPPFPATSYRDAVKTATRWVEKNRRVPKDEFTIDVPIRWDQMGVSPALKDR